MTKRAVIQDQFLTYNKYLRERFGHPVLKIPLHAGFSCPNRDGSRGRGGCTFCDNKAFSSVVSCAESIMDQLRMGIERALAKYKDFIAYFQPYSNTYGSLERLKEVYEPVISASGVTGLAVGTRPDCLSSEVYDYLQEISGRTYLSVELGIQTIHDITLQRINSCRCHTESLTAVRELEKRGIEVVAHVMLGLPGESEDMMMETADWLAGSPVHGVKLHQLMVIAGTKLEQEYRNGELKVLSLEQYAELAAGFISRLRPGQCIHRLAADCLPTAGLLAPNWSCEKLKSLNYIRETVNNALLLY